MSEEISSDTSSPKESSYISSMIDSSLISSSLDSSSLSEPNTYTDSFSMYANLSLSSNFVNVSNHTIISNNINSSNIITKINYTNNSLYFNKTSYNNKSNDSNLTINSNISNIVNSYVNIGKEILENKINIDKNYIIDYIPQIIDSIEISKNYEIKGEDYTLIIRPINAFHSAISTYINFKECEKLLRDALNISSSRIITFLQMEINNKDKSLVNQVEYQVYDDNKTLLNLSLCKDIEIEITYAMKNNSLDMNSISKFNNKGIDVFNINDSFFNDICQPYSDSNNDIVLEDRIKDIYQNYSLCEEGCLYNGIDLVNKTISCDCKVKTNMSLNNSRTITLIHFDDIKIESNFGLIKCYQLVFSFKGKLTNIGFWIFLFFVFAHIPLMSSYFYKGIKPIKDFIIEEMEKNGYIPSNNNEIKNKNNKKNDKVSQKSSSSLINPPKKIKRKNIKDKSIIIDKSSLNNIKSSNRKINNSNSLNIKENENDDFNGNLKKFQKTKENMSKNIKNNQIFNKKKSKKEKNDNKILINNVILLGKSKNKTNKNNKRMKKRIDALTTSDNNKEIKQKTNDIVNYNLINIDLNNIKDYTPKNSLHILNNYTFEEAIQYDMRSICAIFYIFLLSKQAAFHAFLYRSPLESFHLRFCLLIFIISSDLALNAFFYLDDKISKKYKYAQNLFLFAFNSNITIILLSTLIGFIFMTLFTNLSNSTNKIRDIFRNEEEKMIKDKKYKVTENRKKEILEEIEIILNKHKLKVIILISIEILLMLFFWYYVTAFCHVYSSTQTSWLLDSFLSILSRLVIELLLSLGFAKLYRMSVEANSNCIYKFVIFFYCFA